VFSSNRNGEPQIYTMRADGTDVKKLTSRGLNEQPFWGVK
jgi:Tol biopolymer transport system component